MYGYGLIGNCQSSALISQFGSIDWLCLPRPDSDPVFGKILDPSGGEFSISHAGNGEIKSHQYYRENTNILVTELTDAKGFAFRITDFCPRFEQYSRMFRPMSVFRIVEPLAGNPSIVVKCNPVKGWSKELCVPSRGNSHIRFDCREDSLRLASNMPMTYLSESTPFQLNEKIYFALTWSAPLEDDLHAVSEHFLRKTEAYWHTWVKHCNVPVMFQREVIRSALALKLHTFEDTGAILAAVTTSLPEIVGHERNWDYRFCWLRDSYFVLSAFHNLGHFEEMEGFLKFFLDIAHNREDSKERLAPVYTISRDLPLPEKIHEAWEGFKGSKPVRTLNQAAEHVQNDVYGEMILTLAPIYFDERFSTMRDQTHEELLCRIAHHCVESIGKVDAGLWEVRNHLQEHSFTNLMCWAGLDRIAAIQKKGFLTKLNIDIDAAKTKALEAVRRGIVNGSIRNSPADKSFDASLALASVLRFPDDEVNLKTVQEIAQALKCEGAQGFYYRYLREDDFGKPESAFVICSFWVVQSLARCGKIEEARELLASITTSSNHLGLFAEHFKPNDREQLGNFPQAYSHVGMINAAFAVSPSWTELL